MRSTNKGYTLLELVVAMAVMSIAAAMAVTFCIVCSDAVKASTERNVATAQLQSASDFVCGWAACFDSTDYMLESVQTDTVRYVSRNGGQVYELSVSENMITAEGIEEQTTLDISAVNEIYFTRMGEENCYKLSITSADLSAQFIIYKRTD